MFQRMIYAIILVILLMRYGECQESTEKCTIGQGFHGKFAVKEPRTGNQLGNITIDSTKLAVTYKNKSYSYECRAVGNRPDVLLFRTSDTSKPAKVLCLQFIYIADHPFASLVLRRYSKFSPYDKDFFTPLDKSTPGAITCALPDPDNPVEVFLH